MSHKCESYGMKPNIQTTHEILNKTNYTIPDYMWACGTVAEIQILPGTIITESVKPDNSGLVFSFRPNNMGPSKLKCPSNCCTT